MVYVHGPSCSKLLAWNKWEKEKKAGILEQGRRGVCIKVPLCKISEQF